MRSSTYLIAAVTITTFLGGCGTGGPSAQTDSAKTAVAAQAPASANNWVAPANYRDKKNPIAADDASVAAGKALYQKNCVLCHGDTGKGDGPKAKELLTNPGNLTSQATQQQTDGALQWKIMIGKSPMPPFITLKEDERWQLVNYIRTLKADAGTSGTK